MKNYSKKTVILPSNRKFGIFFSFVFALTAAYFYVTTNMIWTYIFFTTSLILLGITIPRYHAVISKFKEKTGCPLVVNTSFNVRGEPIICTPTDAFKCFMETEIDVLAIGNYVLQKQFQNKTLKMNYKDQYELD
jgi:hypothetical protein